ncbi:MAG TPA: histidine kinase, partial [Flavilitoribacter sp.]|nr:histidine kinase [Flavilitoribacter sp.]
NHHAPRWGVGSWNLFYLEEYRLTQLIDLKLTAKIFILAGIYLMAGLYYLFLYLFRKRERVGLIFSGLCFLFFGLIAMEYLKFLYAYPYPFHYTRLLIIYGITFLLAFLVPRFLLLYFDLRYKMIWSLVSIGVLMLISLLILPGTDIASQFLAGAMWLISLFIAATAAFKKRRESQVILAVLLVAGLLNGLYHMAFRSLLFTYDITLFLSFSILVIAMMYLLAMRSREQKRAYENSLMLSARLQNELLRKHIQPHFIMNTLTSLMEWVEESPTDSVRFIEALSGEFEIFSEIADKKLIKVEQEIRLCQYHIEIMKFRKEVDYRLELQDVKMEDTIPPAVLHTLVENGISHSLPDKENRIKMILSFRETDRVRCYELKILSPTQRQGKTEDGTGFRYIKSRLTENYGNRWRLDAQPTAESWITTITIDKSVP